MPTEIKAQNTTTLASVKAIYDAADQANTLLDGMQAAATAAGTTLDGIYQDAADAQTAADDAQASADNASEYAARALGNLSTVQNITETLNWITAHGTMTLTSDVALDPTHVYFVVDAGGDYVVGGTHYSVVTEPDVDDISTYYELSIDESLNNYVATHLAVDSEGLWIIPDAGGNKVLIATGSGSTYTTAGTYIVGKVGGVDTVFAKFLSSGATMQAENGTTIAHLGYGPGKNSVGGTSNAPYYTLGVRRVNSAIGNYSLAQGNNAVASGYVSLSEGYNTNSSGEASHAEGYASNYQSDGSVGIVASGRGAHAGGSTQGDNFSLIEGTSLIKSAGIGSYANGFVITDNTNSTNPYGTILASNYGSHAEGCIETDTSGQTYIQATGKGAHAEGYVADGEKTSAEGSGAHAEGGATNAIGNYSHAEGYNTYASQAYAHAQNLGTVTSISSQTVIGKYNDYSDVSSVEHALEIGNGTADNARSNALTVDWSGNVEAAGDVTDGSGKSIASLSGIQNTYGYLYGISSNVSLSTSGKKITLTTFNGNNCSKSSGGIKVNDAGVYAIEGSAYFHTGFTVNDIMHCLLYVNSSSVIEAARRAYSANPYEIITTGQFITTLAANDVVYLYAYNQAGARGAVATHTNTKIALHRIA